MKPLFVTALFLLSSLTMAQDIFKKNLYSADQIMEAREKINLTDAQATKIKKNPCRERRRILHAQMGLGCNQY